jgi:hypothetical protein
MTTAQVLAIVKDRGMEINLKDGQPLLTRNGYPIEKLGPLRAVLKFHRERIIAILKERQ